MDAFGNCKNMQKKLFFDMVKLRIEGDPFSHNIASWKRIQTQICQKTYENVSCKESST